MKMLQVNLESLLLGMTGIWDIAEAYEKNYYCTLRPWALVAADGMADPPVPEYVLVKRCAGLSAPFWSGLPGPKQKKSRTLGFAEDGPDVIADGGDGEGDDEGRSDADVDECLEGVDSAEGSSGSEVVSMAFSDAWDDALSSEDDGGYEGWGDPSGGGHGGPHGMEEPPVVDPPPLPPPAEAPGGGEGGPPPEPADLPVGGGGAGDPPLPGGGGPPDPPAPLGDGGGGGGGAYMDGPWLKYQLPDNQGVLVFDHHSNSLGAHCPRHRLCRMNRTLNQSVARPGQGRPLGQLIAWLLAAPACATKPDHDRAKTRDAETMSYPSRSRAREWARTLPGIQQILDLERALRPGERSEPLVHY